MSKPALREKGWFVASWIGKDVVWLIWSASYWSDDCYQMIINWLSTGKRNTTTRDWCPFHMSWIKWIQSRWSSTVTGKGPLYTTQYTTTQCHHMIWIKRLYPAARSVMTMIKQIQIQCTTSSISTNRIQSIMRMCNVHPPRLQQLKVRYWQKCIYRFGSIQDEWQKQHMPKEQAWFLNIYHQYFYPFTDVLKCVICYS